MTNQNGYVYADFVDISDDQKTKTKKILKKEKKEKDKSLAKPKKKIVALILLLLVGSFGIHRFYAGKIFSGILCLLTGGFFGFGIFIDGFLILTGRFKDRKGNPLQ